MTRKHNIFFTFLFAKRINGIMFLSIKYMDSQNWVPGQTDDDEYSLRGELCKI